MVIDLMVKGGEQLWAKVSALNSQELPWVFVNVCPLDLQIKGTVCKSQVWYVNSCVGQWKLRPQNIFFLH